MSASAHQQAPRASALTDPLYGTRYRSREVLGRGGMAEVVLAEHLGLGKLFAVKLLRPEFASDASFTTRMQIEARSVASLSSPHIVQVVDMGQTATGQTYLVMERLVGVTLGAEVKARGALPVAEALGYVVQVLAGLEVAHAMGIVHRDIKPENVFLCDATKDVPRLIKILDFGVAKVLDVAGEVGRPALPRLVTAEGGIVGTPRVVAPEQALGKPVDARTDVYAAGLLLYTLLAGRGPFAHISDACELLKANVMERPEPPSKWTEQPIPAALDAAVMRALEKRPADRFPSAGAFATELRAIASAWSRPGPATEVTTGPLPPEGAPASEGPGDDPPREDPTLQLLGTRAASAPDLRDRASIQGHGPGTPGLRSVHRSGTEPRPGHTATALPSRRGWVGWAGFLGLMLLGAALSAVLLLALSRVAP